MWEEWVHGAIDGLKKSLKAAREFEISVGRLPRCRWPDSAPAGCPCEAAPRGRVADTVAHVPVEYGVEPGTQFAEPREPSVDEFDVARELKVSVADARLILPQVRCEIRHKPRPVSFEGILVGHHHDHGITLTQLRDHLNSKIAELEEDRKAKRRNKDRAKVVEAWLALAVIEDTYL
jgi:hypothetical protein